MQKHTGTPTVYNLEVNGYHTYHVGTSGILVHNSVLQSCESRRYDRTEQELKSGRTVKDKDTIKDWDDFLGPHQTNIDPRDGLRDPDRIWSADGNRSIRYGQHEQDFNHYHLETWYSNWVLNIYQHIQRSGKP